MTNEERRKRRWKEVQKSFHDMLNHVMVTAEEKLTDILPHKWMEPVMIPWLTKESTLKSFKCIKKQNVY